MPLPLQLLGGPADLLRIPGMRMPGPRTPNTFPGRPRLPRSLSEQPGPAQAQTVPQPDAPAPSQAAAPASSDAPASMEGQMAAARQPQATPSDTGMSLGSLTTPNMAINNPDAYMTPAERAASQEMQKPLKQAHGFRNVMGKILGGFASAPQWQFLQPTAQNLQHPGLAERNAQINSDLQLGALQGDAVQRAVQMQNLMLQRQEAQQRIEESRQRAANAEVNAQRTSYDRQVGNIEKAGGFEAPVIPPSITQIPVPADTSQPLSPTNLPQRNLILSPGLRPEQSSSLGTVQTLTDPDSGITRNMVYPSKAVQQEIQQAGWPKVTREMAATLSDMGLEEGTPLPPVTYNKLVQAMQTRQTQANKPAPRPISVAPGHRLVDESGNVLYTAPGKPEGDQKPPSRAQFAAIEARKQTALAKAEADARKRLRGSNTVEPEDPDTVYGDLNAQKQQIQDAYESEISALTGNDVGHFEYPAPGTAGANPPAPNATATPRPAGRQQQSAPLPGAGKAVSEAELRRQAAATGKDPDAAVRIAKSRGYRLAP